jgi:enoyl-CoA hydratase/carnithine racemase
MSETLVLHAVDGPVAKMRLNDPDRANVLSMPMLEALKAALDEANADPKVRVIVLGAAGKVFCAGHDLGELRASDDASKMAPLFEACAGLMLAIAASRAPVIAEVRGAAVAAGCQLVASCDLAFAAETAKFAVSGVNLGLFCSTPGVALGRAVGRKAAMEMLLTGKFIDARRAAEIGLVNAAAPAGELGETVQAAAQAIADKPPEAIALGKAVFRRQMEAPLAEAYAIASAAMVENLGFSSAREGIDGFLAR